MKIALNLTRKRIAIFVVVFMMLNIGVNAAFVVPLQSMDFKLLSVKYDPAKSTDKYSYLEVKLLAKNNHWLTAKLDRTDFQLYDSKTGGLVAEGSFGPISIDPGHVGIVDLSVKIYKGEATRSFIETMVKEKKPEGTIKVYYPVSMFGLFSVVKLPASISLSDIFSMGASSTNMMDLSSFIPKISINNISLTREDDVYAEAVVNASGTIPPEISQIGEVKVKNLDLTLSTDKGSVLEILSRDMVLDPNNVEFRSSITLRFIKGEALKDFLYKAVSGEIPGLKASGTISIRIFDMDIDDISIDLDLSQYSESVSNTNEIIDFSSLMNTLSGIVQKMIAGVQVEYLGEETKSSLGTKHKFLATITLRNIFGWKLGWGDLNISIYNPETKNEIVRVIQKEHFSIEPNKTDSFTLEVYMYDNDDLYGLIDSILYSGNISIGVEGTLDAYFAGVWLRRINASQEAGGSLAGASPVSFNNMLGSSLDIGSMLDPSRVKSIAYDFSLTDKELVIDAYIDFEYEKMPVTIYSVRGSVIYDGSYVGTIKIGEIDLDKPTISGLVENNVSVEIRLRRDSSKLEDFVQAFVRGTWGEKTEFIGSADFRFLSKPFYNVPIHVEGFGAGASASFTEIPIAIDLRDILFVKNTTYLGEFTDGNYTVYRLGIWLELFNKYNVPMSFGPGVIVIYDKDWEGIIAKIVIGDKIVMEPYKFSGDRLVELWLYKTNSTLEFLNESLRGAIYPLKIRANLTAELADLNITLNNFPALVATSLLDSLSTAANTETLTYGSQIEILRAYEYSDRIEIYVNATVDVPIPMEVDYMFVTVSLNATSQYPPVAIELLSKIVGPGRPEVAFRVILYNSSPEFEDFVERFVYGDADWIYTYITLDLKAFGMDLGLLTIPRMGIPVYGSGGQQSILTSIKLDRMFSIYKFEYLGMDLEDGANAYVFDLSLNITNNIGLAFSIWDSTIRLIKNNVTIIKVRIPENYTFRPYESGLLNATIYIFGGTPELKEFIEELVNNMTLDAYIDGKVNAKIFGLELPDIRIAQYLLMNVTEMLESQNYADMGLPTDQTTTPNIEEVSLIRDTDQYAEIAVRVGIELPRYPIRVLEYNISIGLPGALPSIRVYSNSTINLDEAGMKEISLRAYIYKLEGARTAEFLRRVIEGKLSFLRISGTALIEMFGVNVSLRINLNNITMLKVTSEAINLAVYTQYFNIGKFEYLGTETVDGREAYAFSGEIIFNNIFGVEVGFGPFILRVYRENTEALRVEIPQVVINPETSTSIPFHLDIFSGNATYIFLRDLIENLTINATFQAYGNITIFGIDLVNLNITYPLLYEISQDVISATNVGGVNIPAGNLKINDVRFNVTYEDQDVAVLSLYANLSNPMVIPLKVYNFETLISKDGTPIVASSLVEPLDLNNSDLILNSTVTFYKNNITVSFIRDVIMGSIPKVDIEIRAYLMFLEWNFTLNISINGLEYKSDSLNLGEVGGIPLDLSDLVVVNRVEQYGDMGLKVWFTINNIFGTTIGFGGMSFAIIYNGTDVVYGAIPDYASAGPGENMTLVMYLAFNNKSETGEFLREVLVDKVFNAEVSLNMSILTLFGMNITNINLAQKVFMDLSKLMSGATVSGLGAVSDTAQQIQISDIQIVDSRMVGSELMVNISAVVMDNFVDLGISNVNFTIYNQYGTIGEVILDHAEFRYSSDTKICLVVYLPYREPNTALEVFIRDLVENKVLRVNVSGTMDIELFGFYIEGFEFGAYLEIPIDESSLNATTAGYASSFVFTEDLVQINSIRQLTFDSSPYVLQLNVSLRNIVNTTITISNVNITIYQGDYELARVYAPLITLRYDELTPTLINITVYDNPPMKDLLATFVSGGELNVTIVGTLTMDILGAHIEDLRLNYTIPIAVDPTQATQTAQLVDLGPLMSNFVEYRIVDLKILGETESTADIVLTLEVNKSSVYIYIDSLDMIISKGGSDIARIVISQPAIFAPWEAHNITIEVTIYKGSEGLAALIGEIFDGNALSFDLRGNITARLLSDTVQYIVLDGYLNITNLVLDMGSVPVSDTVPTIDTGGLVAYQDISYGGKYFDDEAGYYYYVLYVNTRINNTYNISLSLSGLNVTIEKNGVPSIRAMIDELYLVENQTQEVELELWLYDNPQTQALIEELVNNMYLNANITIRINELKIFGVSIHNISMEQPLNIDISNQMNGATTQNDLLSMFNLVVGDIVVWGEDDYAAYLGFQLNISDAPIDAEVYNADIILRYSNTEVATLSIPYLSLLRGGLTSQMVNITILKANKTALQGFLNDLLVRKNVTIDVWGNLTLHLFDSEYLWLDLSLKYNDTVYSVASYYQSLTSGEVDASNMLNNVLQYSAEGVKWEILEETDQYVKIRISEEIWSSLSINIYDMYTELYMEPFNISTLFAIQTVVGTVSIPANGTGNITLEITLFKNRYLQEFLDAAIHTWEISVWADTKLDIGLFGVNITGLEVTSTKFSYIISDETLQSALDSMVSQYASSIDAEAVAIKPWGYGTWYNSSDLYGGVSEAINYAIQVWTQDPSTVNLWDYNWILVEYIEDVGKYDFNVSLLNFRANLVYTGYYPDGSKANGTLEDFFGEIYIENLTLLSTNEHNIFHAYVRLWRLNWHYGTNSSLKYWLWNMVANSAYNFSIVNVTFDIIMWGCYIKNVTINRLNLTGVYDPSDLSNTIKFGGIKDISVTLNGLDLWATAHFVVEVPISPEWLVYYSMVISWDDDPMYFEDYDSGDDPPGGVYGDSGTQNGNEWSVEGLYFKALDINAQPLAHDVAQYYIAPLMRDVPSSLPSYAVWFGNGGTQELSGFIDISLELNTDLHDYLFNADLDQQYDDEQLAAVGQSEREDHSISGISGEGIEDGDDWSLVLLCYEVEIVMFWWVIYYFTPSIYIASGDLSYTLLYGRINLSSTTRWVIYDSHGHNILIYKNSTGGYEMIPYFSSTYNATSTPIIVQGQMFLDAYDGTPDASEPDYSGNYVRSSP